MREEKTELEKDKVVSCGNSQHAKTSSVSAVIEGKHGALPCLKHIYVYIKKRILESKNSGYITGKQAKVYLDIIAYALRFAHQEKCAIIY